MLENLRDSEILEAEYNAYIGVELKLNNKVEVDSPSPLSMHCDNVIHNTFSQDPLAPLYRQPDVILNENSLLQALKEFLMITKLTAPEPYMFDGDPLL